jgi:hypothetical protein
MCKVVNKYKSPYDVYIGRGSPFGNPFVIGTHGDRAEVIRKYKAWFTKQLSDHNFYQQVQQLRGKTLGCFCKPLPCHGDVIVEYLEQN